MNRSHHRSHNRSQHRKPTAAETEFLSGTAVNPYPLIQLEKGSSKLASRALDLICPIGKGQRGLLVSAPGSGKTSFLQEICRAVSNGYPEMKVYCLLIDERPEEVTDFKRNVNGTVFSSSLDQPPDHHLKIVDRLMPEVFELAAEGKDVLILLDSLTRLTRAFHTQHKGKGRTLSGGLSAGALEIPRRLFGAARNVEEMGSITMLATILVDTGSLMDNVIFEEFKGTGNMELVLSRELAQRRLFPTLDVLKSGTRRMELLYDNDTMDKLNKLHRLLAPMSTIDGMKKLMDLLDQYPTNESLIESFR